MKLRHALTIDEVCRMAPSIVSQTPHPDVSKRYCHIRTSDLLTTLVDQGWLPVRATEKPCNALGRKGFQKHIVSFRRVEDIKADGSFMTSGEFKHSPHEHVIEKSPSNPEFFELHLTNSHDRTSSWTFYAGIFRMVCSNDLIVSNGLFAGERLKHINIQPAAVIGAALKVSDSIGTVRKHVDLMREIRLTERQRLDFAEFALLAKYDRDMNRSPILPPTLLETRRPEDDFKDLWTTFNTIQENVMKGLQVDRNRLDLFGRQFGPSNPVKKLERQIALNQELWGYAEGLIPSNN